MVLYLLATWSCSAVKIIFNLDFPLCVAFARNARAGRRSRYARLTVTVPPESPIILQGATVSTQEERQVTLECVSRAGKPAAEVSQAFRSGLC